jgi:hypothetical protein
MPVRTPSSAADATCKGSCFKRRSDDASRSPKKRASLRQCACAGAKENRGPKTRQLLSAVGVVPIRRRCGTTAGAYAADEVLGREGRSSRTLQKHACRRGADGSFATTREHRRERLGVPVSAETLPTMVEGHGQAMQRFQPQDEATAQAFQKAAGAVEFAVAAGKVNSREEGWKDRKSAVIQKRALAQPTAPSAWDKQRLAAATIVLAFAMIATSKVLRRSWRSRLRPLGVASCASVHVLGDGVRWIGKSLQRLLTGCLQTLDFFHAWEQLGKTAAAVCGAGTATAKQAFERGGTLLLEQGWSGVGVCVSELLAVQAAEQRQQRRRITDRTIR